MTEQEVARATACYPSPDITPGEFEQFIVQLLESLADLTGPPVVTLHDKIEGADGTYDFDATARFDWAGMQFLVLAEAKLHKNPIKRELVQVLHDKLRSVGAQKGVMFSTAPYQRGALIYAQTHGIALATVTEGRFTYLTRSEHQPPPLTRQQAEDLFDLPAFVAHAYQPGEDPRTTTILLLSTQDPHPFGSVVLPDVLG